MRVLFTEVSRASGGTPSRDGSRPLLDDDPGHSSHDVAVEALGDVEGSLQAPVSIGQAEDLQGDVDRSAFVGSEHHAFVVEVDRMKPQVPIVAAHLDVEPGVVAPGVGDLDLERRWW